MTRLAAINQEGLAGLRETTPINSLTIRLDYRTSPGDLGGGFFRGVTRAPAGTYVDDDGTVILPTGGDGSEAWLREWDGINADVRWFGAVCNHTTDDWQAATNALALYSKNGSTVRSGTLKVGPGFAHSKPLVYAGDTGRAFDLVGDIGGSQAGPDGSYLKFTGSQQSAIIFYGAFHARLRKLNIVLNSSSAINGLHITADNTINTTLNGAVSLGSAVTINPVAMTGIAVGVALGLGAGTVNFEVVYVLSIGASSFTANLLNNHASGEQVGHSSPSSCSGVDTVCAHIPNVTNGCSVLLGNLISGATPMVSEVSLDSLQCVALGSTALAGVRVIEGGNVKNVFLNNYKCQLSKRAISIESGSGCCSVNGIITSQISEAVIYQQGGNVVVNGGEDESTTLLIKGSSGSNPLAATFIGYSFESSAPATDDLIVDYAGMLNLIGCHIKNGRTTRAVPIFRMGGINQANLPTGFTATGTFFRNVDDTTNFVQDSSGNDMLHGNNPGALVRATMLNCMGYTEAGTTDKLTNLIAGLSDRGTLHLGSYTVAGLAALTPANGDTANVTDADASLAWGDTAINSGSGATNYSVRYNGVAWTVTGK